MSADESLGAKLKGLRRARGCSLSELSRRSGVGKGTISELENDRRGARLDTLFALTTALEAPLGALMPDGALDTTSAVQGDSVAATLLTRWPTEEYLVEVYRATLSERRQESAAHAAGVRETVTVVRGRVRVGCVGDERELGEGESLRYRGDVPHRFSALGATTDVLLLMHYPPPPPSDDGREHSG
ncbi:transcriptional regulator, XRE family with cupin sensor [Streptomyces sp. DvalAA-14]|nr:helix-turn-helix domain-containing protein [Streptomyces sp. SID4948]SCE43641.1 transcriptional regulator, XRE family with cupin sensor [Streptomyces sp. DvalAA-14]